MIIVKLSAAALAVVMTAAIVPMAAHAAENETVVEANVTRPTAYVSYSDLNLVNAEDVQKLNQRVARAARSICVNYSERDLRSIMHQNACRDAALEGAAPQIAAAISNAGDTQVASRASITVALP